MRTNTVLSFERIHSSLQTMFGADLHAKCVASLAGATLGVIESASLAVAMIGQGLALARGRTTKHAIKQVDRLLSNQGIDIDSLLHHWVPYVVGSRPDIKVAMDWTDFEADGQATIMLSLLTRHGRATPLVWLTVDTATLKNRRNGYEYQVLVRLAEVLSADVKVCIVADRGFGDRKLYRMLTEELKFDFIIRFRGNIAVAAADGEVRAAADWVGAGGRARVLRDAAVTAVGYPVKTVVCVQAKDMKEPTTVRLKTWEIQLVIVLCNFETVGLARKCRLDLDLFKNRHRKDLQQCVERRLQPEPFAHDRNQHIDRNGVSCRCS